MLQTYFSNRDPYIRLWGFKNFIKHWTSSFLMKWISFDLQMKTSKAIILAGEMQFTERNCRKEARKNSGFARFKWFKCIPPRYLIFNLPSHSKQHMAVCGLSLHLAISESRKTLEQKFIFQISSFNPHSINERF